MELKKDDTKLIGYACSYIPVELLSATGFRPYRLLHGDINLSRIGEEVVRIDACPLIKSNLGFIIQNQNRFAALVGSTGCDMSRRMFDIAGTETHIPVIMFNNPRTANRDIYDEEIDWLIDELESLANLTFDENVIKSEIAKWEDIREVLRAIDIKRAQVPSLASTVDIHRIFQHYHQGIPEKICTTIKDDQSTKPRVYLLGSPVSYENHSLLELLEERLRIVGDFNCGLTRILNIRIKQHNIDGLREAYYAQPPCIFKRPNDAYYESIIERVKELKCVGVIAYTLDYCDNYEFELKKHEQYLGLPVLKIRSDFSFQNISQMRTRIEAFAEMLYSNEQYQSRRKE